MIDIRWLDRFERRAASIEQAMLARSSWLEALSTDY